MPKHVHAERKFPFWGISFGGVREGASGLQRPKLRRLDLSVPTHLMTRECSIHNFKRSWSRPESKYGPKPFSAAALAFSN